MRDAWKYALGIYLLFVLLSVAASGSFMFLLLLVVVVAVLLRRRVARDGALRLTWTSEPAPQTLHALVRAALPPAADPEAARRLEDARRLLEPCFPEDPLDNARLVQVLDAYTHEPDPARREVEDEYREHRRRFLAWRADVDALESAGGAGRTATVERLEEERVALERYVDGLALRAEEAGGLVSRALDECGRAEAAVERARAATERLAGGTPTPELAGRLAGAESKLREARAAFAIDAERPLTALRLCAEAVSAAQEVERRVSDLVDLPRTVDERGRRFEAERSRVEHELARVREEFEASAETYAPSCWIEVRGAGAAADRALERARERGAAGGGHIRAGRAAEADAELDEAFAALARAAELTRTIGAHLAALEQAALGGRERLAGADREIDRAWAAVRTPSQPGGTTGRERLLERATDLTGRARAEIEKERPDWLTVVELADRSSELARAAAQDAVAASDPDAPAREQALDDARRRAKAARDSAWAWAIVSPEVAAPATASLDAAEAAFQHALRLEAAMAAPASGTAVDEAVEAFRAAEGAAEAVSAEVESERTKDRSRTARAAQGLVWGTG